MTDTKAIEKGLLERLRSAADSYDELVQSIVAIADARGVAGKYSGAKVRAEESVAIREAADNMERMERALADEHVEGVAYHAALKVLSENRSKGPITNAVAIGEIVRDAMRAALTGNPVEGDGE